MRKRTLQCGAPATNSSVWYDYTPTADQTLVIDASSSTYEVGLIVVTGDPGSFILQACGHFSVVLPVASGVTYHILAFGDTPGGDGGFLNIGVDLAPPPPTLAVSLAAPGLVNPKTGVLTLSGTVDCTGGTAATGNISPMATGEGVQLSLDVRQNVGRVSTVHAAVFTSVPCGPATPFTVVVVPDNGLFKPGNVTVTVDAFFCNLSGCAEDLHTVTLRIKK